MVMGTDCVGLRWDYGVEKLNRMSDVLRAVGPAESTGSTVLLDRAWNTSFSSVDVHWQLNSRHPHDC